KPNYFAGKWRRRGADNAVAEPRARSKMANAIHVKVRPPDEDEKQAEADKTTRLRALRLAKEAAGRDAASRGTGQHRRDPAPPDPLGLRIERRCHVGPKRQTTARMDPAIRAGKPIPTSLGIMRTGSDHRPRGRF